MKQYLKLYKNHTEYENSDVTYNISHCINEIHLHYNKEYTEQYITVIFSINGNISGNGYIDFKIMHEFAVENNYYNRIEIDGIEQEEIKTTYRLDARESHIVKYFMRDCTVVDNYAFYNIKNIKKILLPDTIIKIGEKAFHSCDLENIILPDSVEYIDSASFYGTKLKEIIIPKNVKEIGWAAFYPCFDVEKVILNAVIPPIIDNRSTLPNNSCFIYVPNSSVELYKSQENWSQYADRIKPLI